MPCAAAQVIKLPAGKYTVREREMLSGVAGAPESYFMPGNAFSNGLIFCEHLCCSISPCQCWRHAQEGYMRQRQLPANLHRWAFML